MIKKKSITVDERLSQMRIEIACKILKEINAAYPDNLIEQYFNLKTAKETGENHGDTLALFIGRETIALVDPCISMVQNRSDIISALETARAELWAVIEGLHEANKKEIKK
jgi:hypothetical protein